MGTSPEAFNWLKDRLGQYADWSTLMNINTPFEDCYYYPEGKWEMYGSRLVFFKESVDLKTIVEFKLIFG